LVGIPIEAAAQLGVYEGVSICDVSSMVSLLLISVELLIACMKALPNRCDCSHTNTQFNDPRMIEPSMRWSSCELKHSHARHKLEANEAAETEEMPLARWRSSQTKLLGAWLDQARSP
jgi:hypothetical protein